MFISSSTSLRMLFWVSWVSTGDYSVDIVDLSEVFIDSSDFKESSSVLAFFIISSY
jgi:hypothetical protein